MTITPSNYDVVIIGHGPVGSTLANILGQYNISTLILDQEESAYHLPRAVAFDDEIMRIFQSLDLSDQMENIAEVGGNAHFVNNKNKILLTWARPQKLSENNYFVSYRFHQPDLEEVLRAGLQRFPSVTQRWGCKAIALDQTEQSATLQCIETQSGNKHTINTSYIIGCDGAQSFTRSHISAKLEDLGFREPWLVVDLVLKVPKTNASRESYHYCEEERSASSAFVGFKRKRWEFRLNPNDKPEEICKPANVWKLLERWIKPDDAILERATVYTFDSVIAEEWIKGRFLIAGDAAHQTPPFMGQGMCAGIRDVANLGWKLERIIKKNAPNYLLNSYQSERYPHVKEFIKLTIQMGQVINKTKSSIFAGNATNHEDGPQNLGQLKPILGQGPSAGQTKWRGHLFPQPRLEQGRLLDDQIGNQSALILLAEFQKKLSKKLSKNLMETDIAVIADSSDKLREWFKKTSSKAVLIRPDRYISGTAKTEPELHQLLQLYKRGFC